MTGCEYVEAWVGECGDPAWSFDPVVCSDHANETCRVCGNQAVKECPATFGLVCGAPLCEEHDQNDCPVHP